MARLAPRTFTGIRTRVSRGTRQASVRLLGFIAALGEPMAHELSEQDRQVLTRLEEATWREETRFDAAFMGRALAPDFFEIGRSGRTYTRQKTLDIPREPNDAKLPLPDLKVRPLDPDSAQVTYNSEVRHSGVVEFGRRSSIR